jgi:hypothetical protein
MYKLEASFGSVNFGDTSASCSVKIPLSEFSLAKAHKDFCERRLKGEINAKGAAGDAAAQGTLEGMDDDVKIKGVFDVAKISVSKKMVSFTVSFSLRDIDRAQLSNIAKRNGFLIVNTVEDIPEDAPKPKNKNKDEDEGEEGEE